MMLIFQMGINNLSIQHGGKLLPFLNQMQAFMMISLFLNLMAPTSMKQMEMSLVKLIISTKLLEIQVNP